MRDHTYQKMHDYLQLLTNNHLELKEFIGASVDELQEKLSSFDGVQSPFLYFFDYSNKLSGNNQRTFNQKTISFGIAFLGVNVNDFVAINKAIDDAEILGLEVISRINYDSQKPEQKWLYNNFIKESCFFTPVEASEIEGMYGMDFTFDIKVPEPLVVDKTKWSDGNSICTP